LKGLFSDKESSGVQLCGAPFFCKEIAGGNSLRLWFKIRFVEERRVKEIGYADVQSLADLVDQS
jgi:hypothetical protein